MKTSISHIPETKQIELKKIVEIIKKTTYKDIPVEIIILFGSYARGDYVEKDIVQEGNSTLEYRSDFDILVITRKPTQEKNMRLSILIGEKINKDKSITTPVGLIVEDIYHVNARLEENRYFYLDIKKEGIVLYDSKKCKLKKGRILGEEEKKIMKTEDFKMWFGMGEEFSIDYKNALNRGSYNVAVFYLHQATERFITSYMLVYTGYKPKTHDLKVLHEKLVELNGVFFNWFEEDEEEYFELLRKGYVDARYSKDYKITKKQLEFLGKKVIIIKELIEELCKKEIT